MCSAEVVIRLACLRFPSCCRPPNGLRLEVLTHSGVASPSDGKRILRVLAHLFPDKTLGFVSKPLDVDFVRVSASDGASARPGNAGSCLARGDGASRGAPAAKRRRGVLRQSLALPDQPSAWELFEWSPTCRTVTHPPNENLSDCSTQIVPCPWGGGFVLLRGKNPPGGGR